jgi:hypothetical protein
MPVAFLAPDEKGARTVFSNTGRGITCFRKKLVLLITMITSILPTGVTRRTVTIVDVLDLASATMLREKCARGPDTRYDKLISHDESII